MRDDYGGRSWSPTVAILVINILVFFLEASGGTTAYRLFQDYGALSLGGIQRGFVWQFVTFQFMHGGILHLVLNCMTLYSLGRILEAELGKASFLKLYLLSGVAGGVLQLLSGLVVPSWAAPTVGASAGICGLAAAFGLIHADATISMFFVIPFRARYILHLTVGISVLFILLFPGLPLAHGAHLGGAFFGYAYVRWMMSSDWFNNVWASVVEKLRAGRRSRPIVKVRFPGTSKSWESEPVARKESGDFITKEVDPILEKISAHGIHSLTESERQILEAARSRMDKR